MIEECLCIVQRIDSIHHVTVLNYSHAYVWRSENSTLYIYVSTWWAGRGCKKQDGFQPPNPSNSNSGQLVFHNYRIHFEFRPSNKRVTARRQTIRNQRLHVHKTEQCFICVDEWIHSRCNTHLHLVYISAIVWTLRTLNVATCVL